MIPVADIEFKLLLKISQICSFSRLQKQKSKYKNSPKRFTKLVEQKIFQGVCNGTLCSLIGVPFPECIQNVVI